MSFRSLCARGCDVCFHCNNSFIWSYWKLQHSGYISKYKKVKNNNYPCQFFFPLRKPFFSKQFKNTPRYPGKNYSNQFHTDLPRRGLMTGFWRHHLLLRHSNCNVCHASEGKFKRFSQFTTDRRLKLLLLKLAAFIFTKLQTGTNGTSSAWLSLSHYPLPTFLTRYPPHVPYLPERLISTCAKNH